LLARPRPTTSRSAFRGFFRLKNPCLVSSLSCLMQISGMESRRSHRYYAQHCPTHFFFFRLSFSPLNDFLPSVFPSFTVKRRPKMNPPCGAIRFFLSVLSCVPFLCSFARQSVGHGEATFLPGFSFPALRSPILFL